MNSKHKIELSTKRTYLGPKRQKLYKTYKAIYKGKSNIVLREYLVELGKVNN